ncbi:MAG TPA: glycosyl hydrolase family 28-related protein, partial [Thermoanaerobaculia bacterium]|nr:glycosyl hydrolase family 28-related protein [Thermoanaerobaculia bacterium]
MNVIRSVAAFTVAVLLAPLVVQGQTVINVRSAPYNCKGDGRTNDTACFQKAAKAIRDEGGGTLHIPPGTYVVGQQQFAGAPGLGYSYRGADTTGTGHRNIIEIADTTAPVSIVAHGATLRWAEGLKYGFFNPVTGEPEAASAGNAAQPAGMPGADMGAGMVVIRNTRAPVTIEGLELDGNVAGFVFNAGIEIQLWAVNLAVVNARQVTVRDVHTHHSPHDGLYVGYKGRKATDPDTPVLLERVRSEYNSRLDLAWTGGNGLTAIDSTFAFGGSNGFITTGPASNLDIEVEFAESLARGRFINCHFIHVQPTPALYNGWNVVAVTGASSDVVFEGCTFENYSNDTVVVNRLRYRFVNCRFHGRVSAGPADAAGGTTPEDSVSFHDSYFDDRPHPLYGVPFGDYLFRTDTATAVGGVVIDGCTFVANHRQSILLRFPGEGEFATVRNSRFHHNWTLAGATQQHATFDNVVLENVAFTDAGSELDPGRQYDARGTNIAGGHVRV